MASRQHSSLTFACSTHSLQGVSLNLKYTRMNQVYSLPIHLTPEISAEGIIAGTVLPVCLYSCPSALYSIPHSFQVLFGLAVQRFILAPFRTYEAKRKLREKRRMFRKFTQQRRQEALVSSLHFNGKSLYHLSVFQTAIRLMEQTAASNIAGLLSLFLKHLSLRTFSQLSRRWAD